MISTFSIGSLLNLLSTEGGLSLAGILSVPIMQQRSFDLAGVTDLELMGLQTSPSFLVVTIPRSLRHQPGQVEEYAAGWWTRG
jgi:hypothetical protein